MKCDSLTERAIVKGTVLIAGSDPSSPCKISDLLRINGYDVVSACDGASFFDNVERHAPDVILLDRLPDGVAICRRLKRDQNTSGIPIIILSDTVSTTDKVAGLSAGADDCITLPFNNDELTALICARLRAKSEWDELRQKTRHLEDMLTRVETLAYQDALTGLLNRRRFESVLSLELKRAERYNLALSCLVLDFDHFKSINDTFGHQAGDEVLKETAGIIQNCIREMDVAARWGGEEFIVLTPSTDKDNALIVGEKIRKAVSEFSHTCIENKTVTLSIGVAGVPDSQIQNVGQLVHAADTAMYTAKRNGRNRVVIAA